MNSYVKRLKLQSCTSIFIDPGIDGTGYSVWRHCLKTGRKLLSYGLLKATASEAASKNESIMERAFFTASSLIPIVQHFSVRFSFIEQPQQTVYGGNRQTRVQAVARAQSVFKTFAVAYCMFGRLIPVEPKITQSLVLPSDWQYTKKQRGGLDTKEWSLLMANGIIGKYADAGVTDACGRCVTLDDVSDAITMGMVMMDKMEKEAA